MLAVRVGVLGLVMLLQKRSAYEDGRWFDRRSRLPMAASLPFEQFIHVSLRDLVQNRHPTETEGAATADCA